VVSPLGWLWHYAIWVPFRWIRAYVVMLLLIVLLYLVVLPLTWLGKGLAAAFTWLRAALVAALTWLAKWLVVPLWRFLVAALSRLGRGAGMLWRGLVRWVLIPGWHGAGWILAQVYRWILRPVGRAFIWVWRFLVRGWRATVLPCWRRAAAGGRWVRESVLRPAAAAARSMSAAVKSVWAAVGLSRRR
jgi:hypothetical protein